MSKSKIDKLPSLGPSSDEGVEVAIEICAMEMILSDNGGPTWSHFDGIRSFYLDEPYMGDKNHIFIGESLTWRVGWLMAAIMDELSFDEYAQLLGISCN